MNEKFDNLFEIGIKMILCGIGLGWFITVGFLSVVAFVSLEVLNLDEYVVSMFVESDLMLYPILYVLFIAVILLDKMGINIITKILGTYWNLATSCVRDVRQNNMESFRDSEVSHKRLLLYLFLFGITSLAFGVTMIMSIKYLPGSSAIQFAIIFPVAGPIIFGGLVMLSGHMMHLMRYTRSSITHLDIYGKLDD